MLATFIDITERKKIERELRIKTKKLEALTGTLEQRVQEEIDARRKSELMLQQKAKMAAMGEMLGAVAHQWRQPLNGVGLIIQDLAALYKTGEMDEAYFESGVQSAMELLYHMSNTITDFRNFFKPSRGKEHFCVIRALRETLSLVEPQLKAHFIEVRHQSAEESLEVQGYPNEFKHVLLNIILNAKDAILEAVGQGKLPDSEHGEIHAQVFRSGEKAIVVIRDNAGGIPEALQDRIFEPYFTTKDQGKGTGLGLYIAKTIIENNMGGRLSVCNVPHGASFRIEV